MKSINKLSRMPLYSQLMDIIVEMIEKGNLGEHDQLPSERELCDNYNISRSTVRQAIQELEKEGYIYRLHGKGTFVSPEMFKQNLLKFYSFTEEMKKLGKIPSSKVLDFEIIESDSKIAAKIQIEPGGELYKFTRIRYADEKPMMVETSYLPLDRFPGLTETRLEEEAMYDIFTKEYNVVFSSSEESFKPVLTRENEAKLLEYHQELPSMLIERITYENGNIIEYTKSIARGDKFEYHVVLNK